MSISSQTFRGRLSVEASTTPKIYNVTTSATPNTELSIPLSASVKQLLIRNRGNGDLKVCFEAGQSGSNYFTILGGNTYTVENLLLFAASIYLQTTEPSQDIEILEWS